ncbi:MAG: macro domain-containing protein [Thermoguttaceae bacterium]|jgi:O-acetyl-ADP-ribose deacetylase (regulator of RNase III)|nr:macro domain-containing protein [Thermoguttaceae bacterium]
MSIRKSVELPGGRRLHLSIGNLLDEPVDAIVNAANSHLAHGGGVAGAIARAAGRSLQEESSAYVRDHGPVPVGSAVVTTAGALRYKGVIHAVGPSQGMGDEAEKLASAVCSALDRAHERGWASVAMPGISSGIFAVPPDTCARAYVQGVLRHFRGQADSAVREVRITLLPGAQGGELVRCVEAEMDLLKTRDESEV